MSSAFLSDFTEAMSSPFCVFNLVLSASTGKSSGRSGSSLDMSTSHAGSLIGASDLSSEHCPQLNRRSGQQFPARYKGLLHGRRDADGTLFSSQGWLSSLTNGGYTE